jgi:hypothetical protein
MMNAAFERWPGRGIGGRKILSKVRSDRDRSRSAGNFSYGRSTRHIRFHGRVLIRSVVDCTEKKRNTTAGTALHSVAIAPQNYFAPPLTFA